MKKVYIAGDGLKKGNQLLRKIEREALEKIEGIEIYNPWDNKSINDKSKEPMAEDIFWGDTKAILESDVIVADVHNDNVGTAVEMGLIWGINHMREKIIQALISDDLFKELRNILQDIPHKQVYWQTTDIRDTDIEEKGFRRSHSYNQYLIGTMLDMAGEPTDFAEIVEKISESHN